MDTKVDHCSGSRAYECPAIKVVRVHCGVYGPENQSLNASNVSRMENIFGIFECSNHVSHCICVMLISPGF